MGNSFSGKSKKTHRAVPLGLLPHDTPEVSGHRSDRQNFLGFLQGVAETKLLDRHYQKLPGRDPWYQNDHHQSAITRSDDPGDKSGSQLLPPETSCDPEDGRRPHASTADAVEEAILNALCMAETMVGMGGLKVDALPLEKVKELMQKYL
ncbi:hypothetical protein C8R43DRAFT_1106587 [Mycena crocata]|nr:hypothetical protein C8R43DRAFT_1106587 [Mycena crocata]